VRADRLLRLVLLLQNNGKMTSAEMAAELEVNTRTIVRDMEALSSAGIPVYAERGPQGGWRLTDGYRTNLTGMNSREVLSLLLAASPSLFRDLGIEDQHKSAASKLLAASSRPLRQDAEMARERLHIDGAGWHPSTETVPLLPVIQEAVWTDSKLVIEYAKDSGEVSRIVCPLGIVAKGTIWYLVAATDGSEGEIRTYRVSRIRKAAPVHGSFVRPNGFNLAEYWDASTREFKSRLPIYPADLLVAKDAYSRLARERYVQVISSTDMGSSGTRLEVQFNTLDSACEIILGYGRRVRVLAPEELRARIIAEAAAILTGYGQDPAPLE